MPIENRSKDADGHGHYGFGATSTLVVQRGRLGLHGAAHNAQRHRTADQRRQNEAAEHQQPATTTGCGARLLQGGGQLGDHLFDGGRLLRQLLAGGPGVAVAAANARGGRLRRVHGQPTTPRVTSTGPTACSAGRGSDAAGR